jgi:hypothetical protein
LKKAFVRILKIQIQCLSVPILTFFDHPDFLSGERFPLVEVDDISEVFGLILPRLNSPFPFTLFPLIPKPSHIILGLSIHSLTKEMFSRIFVSP